ncbi:hypothetical protein DIS24_g8876 [Lasiodiplodia hormozganensis]|uniref:Uncharacterized protein n=1 Tax=Lasiodiplodia hormozganensis TaxID=869390 RepID=A0AA40CM83_9PEZI|nr:hypothetical protein DIS24_g8876 [Lasiodiplodia hormozganensis]
MQVIAMRETKGAAPASSSCRTRLSTPKIIQRSAYTLLHLDFATPPPSLSTFTFPRLSNKMPYSQPPFNTTSQASDWPPFLEQGSTSSTNDNLDLDFQWLDEALASLPSDNCMTEGPTMANFDMGLPALQQNFLPTTDHSIAAPEPQHGAIASSSFNPLMDDNAWMFQPGSMAGATDRCEADSLAGPATFGISAPFGAGQWGLPQMFDQPMSLVPQAGATPFEFMLEPMASMHAAQPGVGYASTLADAG